MCTVIVFENVLSTELQKNNSKVMWVLRTCVSGVFVVVSF